MKLFQQMLVAGTAMSLIAPIAAQASDSLNHNGINTYVPTERNSKRIDSKTFVNNVNEELATLEVEAQQYDFEAGSFSDTTTLDGKAIMWIGAIDGADEINADGNAQSVQTGYTYTMNLNTSFNGDDNLYVRLKGGENGNQWGDKETYHIETKDTTSAFNVDKIWYTWNVTDEVTAFVGPKIENYYMYITPSIYQPGVLKSMKLGGNSNFGASTDVGFGFKYENESGFGFASNIVTVDADTAEGMLGKTDKNKWDTQIAYTTDNWHVSATLSDAQNWTSQSYNATTRGAALGGDCGSATTCTTTDTTGYALRGYWRPDNSGTATPEVTIGYDTKSLDNATGTVSKTADSYFVGLTWRDMFQADDRIGVAFTQPLRVTEMADGSDTGEVDPFVWEAYYSFRPNDSIEIRPAVFGGSDVTNDIDDDIFGIAVTSVFKF